MFEGIEKYVLLREVGQDLHHSLPTYMNIKTKFQSGLILILSVVLFDFMTFQEIKTDGVFDEGEWAGSTEISLALNKKLLIRLNDAVLNIGLQSDDLFWCHLYLSDGKTIQVMHSSAALDAIQYRNENGLWLTKDQFEYELRDRIYNAETARKHTEYFNKYNWVANNSNMGNKGTMEIRINTKGWSKPLYFACVMVDQKMSLFPFPKELRDHTVLPKLVQGYAVDSLKFAPTQWHSLK